MHSVQERGSPDLLLRCCYVCLEQMYKLGGGVGVGGLQRNSNEGIRGKS